MAQDMSNTTRSTDEGLLMIKIQTLLRQQVQEEEEDSSYTSDELTLSALVLLSRISDDTILVQLWREHGPRFWAFCTKWYTHTLISNENDQKSNTDNNCHPELLPLRWIAYWVQRLLVAAVAATPKMAPPENNKVKNADTKLTTILESFRDFFWKALTQIKITDTSFTSSTVEAEMDVMECLLDLEEMLPSLSLQLDCFHSYCMKRLELLSIHRDCRQTSDETRPNKDEVPSATAVQSPPALLNQTLLALLPKQASTHDSDVQEHSNKMDITARYDRYLQALVVRQIKSNMMTHQSNGIATRLSSLWTDIVEFWWSKASAKRDSTSANQQHIRRIEWTKILLELLCDLHHYYHRNDDPQRTLDWGSFWEYKSHWDCWTRLTMSSVSSTDFEIRQLAWVSVADIIVCTGWQTLVRLGNDPSVWISTILRLATGEVKIQLGEIVSATQSTSEDVETFVQILCRIILLYKNLIQVLVDIQEEEDDVDDHNNMNSMVSPEFLGSLHRSLEEALDTSTQYLNVATHRYLKIDTSVISLLGNLLTEFDVFLDKSTGEHGSSDEDGDERNVIAAVVAAIKICPLESRRDLFLGLTSVLASAEGDPSRLSLLKKHKVVGETLLTLLVSCWKEKRSDDESLLPVVCDMVEVLADVFPSTRFTNVCCAILEWIEHECLLTDIDAGSLKASLDCVMRLLDDDSPTESAARILGLAHSRLQ
jgi:hypothetical protein